ncbi:PKD domain-containing protein, partial [Methanoregula sp.]|uniref:PKD domain-containing protein n=1 Tax=Methanoregula sp. TaxID=2052170 RepID=UPI000CB421A0
RITPTAQNPSHTFSTAGTYTVKLTLTRGTETASTTQIINGGGVPDAEFVGSPLQVNPNEKIQFTDKSGHAPTAWSWDFGDTAISTVQNPSHSYQVKGIYTVSLTARNENGKDTEIKKGYVNVGMPPKADFYPVATPYAQYSVPKTVQFVDQSTNMPTSWNWDFGDGSTSTEQKPTHVYMKEGIYTVTLTVKNNFGSDTAVKQDLITVGGGVAVDFVADKTTVGVGRVVSFTDLSTSNPTNWVWDFGDGTTGTGPNPDKVYRATGVYDVTLTASNPYQTNTRTKNQYITVLSIPRADFVADRTKGGAPMAVAFTDKSTNAPTGWKWDFGDGASSTEQNPTHTYTTLGIYSVTLTASNKDGSDTTTKVNYISTTLAPVAEFKANRQVGKAPFIVEFTDLSSNKPTSWSWDFGDGTSSTEQNPRHIYLREGSYDVSLTVANQYGTDTIYKTGTSTPASAVVTTEAPVAAATEQPAAVATTQAPVAQPTATKAPLSAAVPLLAAVIALIGAVLVSRK